MGNLDPYVVKQLKEKIIMLPHAAAIEVLIGVVDLLNHTPRFESSLFCEIVDVGYRSRRFNKSASI